MPTPKSENSSEAAKTLIFVAEAYINSDNDYANAPTYCAFIVDADLIDRLRTLIELCSAHTLSSVKVACSPHLWGPAGYEEEARLQDGELEVFIDGTFQFIDRPRHTAETIQSRRLDLQAVLSAVQKGDAEVVFQSETVETAYAQDHCVEEES